MSIRVENGWVRPSERATTLRRGSVAARSPRRARSRTLFAPGPRFETVVEGAAAVPTAVATPVPDAEPVPGAPTVDDREHLADLALEEFVVDADDYPEVIGNERTVTPSTAQPDRVDDIDEWLEEFAVSDCFDALPH